MQEKCWHKRYKNRLFNGSTIDTCNATDTLYLVQKPANINCERIHPLGPYQYSTDDFNNSKETGRVYVDIEVNAGETITFSVKARNNKNYVSDAATIDITGPDVGKLVYC